MLPFKWFSPQSAEVVCREWVGRWVFWVGGGTEGDWRAGRQTDGGKLPQNDIARGSGAARSYPARKPIDRIHRLNARLNFSQVNGGSQEFDFGCFVCLIDVDVPRPRSAVGAIAPTIAPLLQRVLQFERRLFGPNAQSFAPGAFQENGEGGSIWLR
jgi:hypothetical protein